VASVLRTISDLGDTAVLLPVALALTALVWRFQSWAAAVCLSLAFAFCLLTMLILKVSFIACSPMWHVAIVSPSGHASFSTAAYGALGLIAARHAQRWQRPIIAVICLLVIAGVALSRVALGSHTAAEMALGLAVGLFALGLFTVFYMRLRPGRVNVALLFGVVAAIIFAFHGLRLPAEEWIRHLAGTFKLLTGACTTVEIE